MVKSMTLRMRHDGGGGGGAAIFTGLDLSHDAKRVVVATRSAFRVFAINDTAAAAASTVNVLDKKSHGMWPMPIFNEIHSDSLASVQSMSGAGGDQLNAPLTSVAWSPVNDATVVTPTSSGAVLIWNLAAASSRSVDIIQEHWRSVPRVSFRPSDKNMFLTCSQDAHCRLLDIRVRKAVASFALIGSPFINVAFALHAPYVHFVSALESGNVVLWDLRKPSSSDTSATQPSRTILSYWTAQVGSITGLDWNAEISHCLATSGRDRFVNVWQTNVASVASVAPAATSSCVSGTDCGSVGGGGMMTTRPALDTRINAARSVADVRWRPGRPAELATLGSDDGGVVTMHHAVRPLVASAQLILCRRSASRMPRRHQERTSDITADLLCMPDAAATTTADNDNIDTKDKTSVSHMRWRVTKHGSTAMANSVVALTRDGSLHLGAYANAPPERRSSVSLSTTVRNVTKIRTKSDNERRQAATSTVAAPCELLAALSVVSSGVDKTDAIIVAEIVASRATALAAAVSPVVVAIGGAFGIIAAVADCTSRRLPARVECVNMANVFTAELDKMNLAIQSSDRSNSNMSKSVVADSTLNIRNLHHLSRLQAFDVVICGMQRRLVALAKSYVLFSNRGGGLRQLCDLNASAARTVGDASSQIADIWYLVAALYNSRHDDVDSAATAATTADADVKFAGNAASNSTSRAKIRRRGQRFAKSTSSNNSINTVLSQPPPPFNSNAKPRLLSTGQLLTTATSSGINTKDRRRKSGQSSGESGYADNKHRHRSTDKTGRKRSMSFSVASTTLARGGGDRSCSGDNRGNDAAMRKLHSVLNEEDDNGDDINALSFECAGLSLASARAHCSRQPSPPLNAYGFNSHRDRQAERQMQRAAAREAADRQYEDAIWSCTDFFGDYDDGLGRPIELAPVSYNDDASLPSDALSQLDGVRIRDEGFELRHDIVWTPRLGEGIRSLLFGDARTSSMSTAPFNEFGAYIDAALPMLHEDTWPGYKRSAVAVATVAAATTADAARADRDAAGWRSDRALVASVFHLDGDGNGVVKFATPPTADGPFVTRNAEALVAAILLHLADLGELQTVASVALTLGPDRCSRLFATSHAPLDTFACPIRQWVMEYVVLLRRTGAHVAAARIVKHCFLPSLRESSTVSTWVAVHCGRCKFGLGLPQSANVSVASTATNTTSMISASDVNSPNMTLRLPSESSTTSFDASSASDVSFERRRGWPKRVSSSESGSRSISYIETSSSNNSSNNSAATSRSHRSPAIADVGSDSNVNTSQQLQLPLIRAAPSDGNNADDVDDDDRNSNHVGPDKNSSNVQESTAAEMGEQQHRPHSPFPLATQFAPPFLSTGPGTSDTADDLAATDERGERCDVDALTAYCRKCKSTDASRCSVCRQPCLTGLYIWCQGCGHGGHAEHIRDWFGVPPFEKTADADVLVQQHQPRRRRQQHQRPFQRWMHSAGGIINIDNVVRQNGGHRTCAAGCGHYCEYQ